MTTETAAPPSVPQPPKTSALAIWSLVLGILSITCLWICGTVPAVICGVMALSRINKSAGALTGQGLAIAGIVTGGVGILSGFILAGMLLPALNAAREKAREQVCMANLRQISMACFLYADEHQGAIPGNLDQVKSHLGSTMAGPTLKVFICPSAKNSQTPSYEIIGGGTQINAGTPATAVLIRETEPNHRQHRNVCYKDGHVAREPN